MGLFSSILHLRPTSHAQALSALDTALADFGLQRVANSPVPHNGPGVLSCPAGAAVQYLVSARASPWLTIIESQVPTPPAPHIADLGRALSLRLDCYALDLSVHDDDVLFYDLHYRGQQLDSYDSCPQYFESARLSEHAVENQRHTPHVFAPLLPPGTTVSQLASVLQAGWWAAHDGNRLDSDGVPTDDADFFFGAEGDRMAAIGEVLQLNGPGNPYPFAAWAEDSRIPWHEFVAITYEDR